MPTRKICRRSSVKVIIYCEPAALLLKLLYTAKVPDREIVNFYTACIRPILEYASTVFHYSLPKYLSDEMERVQKRSLRIVYPSMHYNEALIESGLETLCARRYAACVKLFSVILDDPNHRLNELVPRSSSHLNYKLREEKNLLMPKFFYRSMGFKRV